MSVVYNRKDFKSDFENCCDDDNDSEFINRYGDNMVGSLTAPNIILSSTTNPLIFADGTIQSTAFNADSQILLDIKATIPTDLNTKITNLETKTTAISYIAQSLNRTTISNNCFITNLTCGNINTSHLSSTTSNLQNQINNINLSATPIGSILIHAGSSAPDGYLLCNGTAYSQIQYANLYSVIGHTYRNGRTTTYSITPDPVFYVPDLCQCYVKGAGQNGTYDITSVGVGNLGAFQSMSVQKHRHEYVDKGAGNKSVIDGSGVTIADNDTKIAYTNAGIIANDGDVHASIGVDETRPNTLVMNYIIKY